MLDSFDLLVLAGAVVALAIGLMRRPAMWAAGATEPVAGPWGPRWRTLFLDAVAHVRILRERAPGLMHLGIFCGVALPLMAVAAVTAGLRLPWIAAAAVSLLLDLAALCAAAALSYAVWRRYVKRLSRLDNKAEDALVLGLLGGILLTGFCTAGIRVAATAEGPFPSPVTWVFSLPFRAIPEVARASLVPWVWKTHFLLVCGLIAAVPFTRLLHVLTSPLNILFRRAGDRGVATFINLEDENADQFGAASIEHLTWKDLLDLDACTRCGRCQDNCPAHLTEKPLSPKKAIQDLKGHWLKTWPAAAERKAAKAAGRECDEGGDAPGMVDDVVTRDVIWSCTTCGWCEEICPVYIEPIRKFIDMRRHLVLMESSFPNELKDGFKNIENNGNPWGVGFSGRADWADGLDVPVLEEGNDEVEVLYWVGCAGSFDDRYKKISRDLVKIFRAAGVSFGILGTDETCCGDPARRTGNEYLFQMQAQTNVENLKSRRFKRIVTQCPHGLQVLGREYGQFGGNFEVVSHAAFIDELIKSGRLKLGPGSFDGKVAFHDSCYLGRYRGLYDEPRDVLKSATGADPLEAERNRERSFCCGAGGGRMWLEENLGKRINNERFDQLAKTGCSAVVTACPFCLTMMDDARKDRGMDEKVKALDVAEIVAARIPGQPEHNAAPQSAETPNPPE